MKGHDELVDALIDLAHLAGAFDGRRPSACAEDRGGGLEAALRLLDALWDGRPFEHARVTGTDQVIDSYWRGHASARMPSEVQR